MDLQQAKIEFETVVENAMEDSPSRRLARQKLQKVRSMSASASSPLYRAVLEDMAGGLGSPKKRGRSQSSGFVVLNGRKIPKNDLESGSLYRIVGLWMLDSPESLDSPETNIDVYNLPAVDFVADYTTKTALSPEKAKTKRDKVQKTLLGKGKKESFKVDTLRQEMLDRAKKARTEHVAILKDIEGKSEARLTHLEKKTSVQLRGGM